MNNLDLNILLEKPSISFGETKFFLNLSLKSIIFFEKWREKFSEEQLEKSETINEFEKKEILKYIIDEISIESFFSIFDRQEPKLKNILFDKIILYWIKKAIPLIELETSLSINPKKKI